MKALQFISKDVKLSLLNVPKPTTLEKDEVLIKVKYAGVCGTDLHIVEVTLRTADTLCIRHPLKPCSVFVGSVSVQGDAHHPRPRVQRRRGSSGLRREAPQRRGQCRCRLQQVALPI